MSALWVLIILATTNNGVAFSQSIGPYLNINQCEAAGKIVKEQLTVERGFRTQLGWTKIDTTCIPIVVKQQ
jgi:hypothetical protein